MFPIYFSETPQKVLGHGRLYWVHHHPFSYSSTLKNLAAMQKVPAKDGLPKMRRQKKRRTPEVFILLEHRPV